MQRREFLGAGLAATQVGPAAVETVDALVYGSTPGGIAAAVEAARRGLKVVLACPKNHPGGMAASGLSTTDAVRPELFGGFCAEFIAGVRDRYRKLLGENHPEYKLTRDGWFYEPSVAEEVFRALIEKEQDRLRWLRGHHLDKVDVQGARITRVELEGPGGKRVAVAARTYIDGTYEGDLAGLAKVPCRVGREGRDEFGESFAGIHYMDWRTGKQILTPDTGEPSLAIQAFCARSIFTDDPAHRIPIEKPASYDQHLPDFLPLLDDFASGRTRSFGPGSQLPRRKFQMNGSIEGLTSLNLPGASWSWPEASRRHRERLEQFHLDHAAGLLWFLQNEPRVPDAIRARLKPMGLHREEFKTTGHWPWQIYVRQGRRIEGRAIVTQHNFIVDPKTRRTPKVPHPIAIGEHSFDVHPCHDRRYAIDGLMEGVLWYPKKALGPAQPGQIAYGAMVPKTLDNLLAPVPLSSTHIAMSVLRMEPVWMTTGQIAGLAAAVAKDQNTDVSRIDPDPLPKTLAIKADPYA